MRPLTGGQLGYRRALSAIGVVVGIVGLVGVFQSARFAVSSALYRQARYGEYVGGERREVRALGLANAAYRLDPENHNFWSWLADRLAGAYEADRNPEMKAGAALWAERGLAVNRYGWRVNVVHTKVLAETAPGDALLFWSRYVDWHYWEPFNHAYLSELNARTGDFSKALEVLRRIEGMPYHEETQRIVMEWIRR